MSKLGGRVGWVVGMGVLIKSGVDVLGWVVDVLPLRKY